MTMLITVEIKLRRAIPAAEMRKELTSDPRRLADVVQEDVRKQLVGLEAMGYGVIKQEVRVEELP